MLLSGARSIESHGYERKIDVNIRYGDAEVDIKGVKAGDREAQELAIRLHVGLVLSIIGRYIPQAPYKKDDIIGAGLLGLVKAVNRFSDDDKQDHPNLTGFIVKTVHGRIQDFLESDHVVNVPRSTIRLRLKDVPDEMKDEMLASLLPEIVHASSEWMFPARRSNKLYGLYREILNEVMESETERYIVEKRIEGWNDEDIGAKLDLSKMRISQLRKGLYRRFKLELKRIL